MPKSKPLAEGKKHRRVHVTLTRGQDLAIRGSTLYRLCDERIASVIVHWVKEGIMRDIDRAGR